MKKFKAAGWKPVVPSRSNTTSSIRGRISAPIPHGPTAAAAVDEEFPLRTPGTSVAAPLGHDGLGLQLGAPPAPLQADTTQYERGDIPAGAERPSKAVSSVPSSAVPSHETPISQARQASPLPGSGVSNPSASSIEKPQRKKSTLKSVLGRLFGKKRKSASSVNVGREDSPRAGQHRSDPSALRKPGGQAKSPQRSASMPINDFSRARSSHTPFEEDTKPRASGNIRDSRDIDGRTRPRRSTTPSRLYEPSKSPGYVDWTGLSPRPASGRARDSVACIEDDPHGLIGFAVTSGSHPNRRSRSMGNIRDAAIQHGVRRRSDEIRYWRESYPSYDPDALSPVSSQLKPEMSSRCATREGNATQEPERQENPQPFNFGPLGEMAGMKITEAASLDARVSTLDARLEAIEKDIANLHEQISAFNLSHRDSPKSLPEQNTYFATLRTDVSDQSMPRLAPSRVYQQNYSPQADASYRMQNQSFEDSRPSTTSTRQSEDQSYVELSPRPTYLATAELTSEVHLLRSNLSARHSESMGRPLSTSTTIRGIASSSPVGTPERTHPLSKNGSLTAHHYTALLNLITAEQSARQSLEAQVASLQQQVQYLLSKSGGGDFVLYETPRSEKLPSRKTLGTGEFSSFEHEESGTESEGEMYGGGVGGLEEAYQMPDEERGGQYVATDDYDDEVDEMETQRDPRTLSLSQLTMSKSALAGVGF